MRGRSGQTQFIADYIKERAPTDLLYRQPAVLLVYWAVKQAPNSACKGDLLSEDELAPIYSDLGLRYPGT